QRQAPSGPGSSQLFMNRPSTRQPCSRSSRAATEESTPPDRPTTTRAAGCACADSAGIDMSDKFHGITPAGEVVVDARENQRTAQAPGGGDLFPRQPRRPQYPLVQRLAGV